MLQTRLELPLRLGAVAGALALAAQSGWAQPATAEVVVTGSPTAQRVLDLPFAITSVNADALRDAGPMINLSEALVQVPGLVVNNRNNYAQDLQISSRGFGARATFGVRGLRLYTDGIPATMPDGQGQVAHFDLAAAQRVEVLRGPFSVLYGNSSGGVIAMFTAPVKARMAEVGIDAGSFGLRQGRVGLSAPLGTVAGGALDLRASVTMLDLDGFRPQSAADRQLGNVRLGWQGASDSVTVQVSDHEQSAQDPLGLTPTDFAANPRMTFADALEANYNTRKTIRQTQGGVNWRHRFAAAGPLRELSLTAYTGSRSVTQFLAIAPTVQRNPTLPAATAAWRRHGGGVVDFDRGYGGAEARLHLGWDRLDLVLGVSQESQRDERRGFENFTGPAANPPFTAPTVPPTVLGVYGERRRDETNRAKSRDGFVQAEAALSPTLAATAGVRSGRTQVSVSDRYITTGNKDDSGALKFSYTNPVLGLRWSLRPQWTLHASAARGFESPTLGELAYSADNSGFNFGVKGQTSRQFELGSKWRSAAFDLDLALFKVDTRNEIAVVANSGGRSSFANVDNTRREGAELAARWRVTPALRAQAAVSLLRAEYQSGYLTCTAVPCAAPTVAVAAGNRIAGTQGRLGWAELAWKPGLVPGELGLEVRGQARTAANDTNRIFAPGFGLLNLRWRHDWPLGRAGSLQTLVRVDNLADRDHVGSVIVNGTNDRVFEPGAPRSVLLSARWQLPW